MLNAVNNDCKQTNQEKPHSLFFNITFIWFDRVSVLPHHAAEQRTGASF